MRLSLSRPAPVVAGLLLVALVAGACKGAPSSPTPPPPPPPPALTLTGIAPASGAVGTTVAVTLTGTGFEAGLTVAVSGAGVTVSSVAVVNATTLTADLVIAGAAAPGGRVVTVTTAAGTSGSLPFAVSAAAPPPPPPPPPPAPGLTLTRIAPTTGNIATTVAVTLTGTGFVPGSTTVVVGGGGVGGSGVTVQNVVVTSATTVTANLVIDGYRAALGGRTVAVQTPAGISPAVGFTVAAGGRFVDLGQAVRDTQTNLIWEKKLPADPLTSLQDVDNLYTWCHATGDRMSSSAPSDSHPSRNCLGNTASWIRDFNQRTFIGLAFGDWRVPTVAELESILLSPCPGGNTPCIDPIFGPTKVNDYWVSDAVAITISFRDGRRANLHANLHMFFVRAVRSGP